LSYHLKPLPTSFSLLILAVSLEPNDFVELRNLNKLCTTEFFATTAETGKKVETAANGAFKAGSFGSDFVLGSISKMYESNINGDHSARLDC
jgi:hypothetical protein